MTQTARDLHRMVMQPDDFDCYAVRPYPELNGYEVFKREYHHAPPGYSDQQTPIALFYSPKDADDYAGWRNKNV